MAYAKRKVDLYGTIRFFDNKGKLHNTDGPAVIWNNGTNEYYHHGVLHAEGRPTASFANGTLKWYNKGVLTQVYRPGRKPNTDVMIQYVDGYKSTEQIGTNITRQYHLGNMFCVTDNSVVSVTMLVKRGNIYAVKVGRSGIYNHMATAIEYNKANHDHVIQMLQYAIEGVQRRGKFVIGNPLVGVLLVQGLDTTSAVVA